MREGKKEGRKNGNQEGFTLAHTLRVQSFMVGSARQLGTLQLQSRSKEP